MVVAAVIVTTTSPSTRPAAAPTSTGLVISGGTAEQRELARWSIERFGAAGLVLPPIEIRFHVGGNGCGGHIGYSRAGVVDVCSTLVNAMSRRIVLHELAHAWAAANVTGIARERFLWLRGLASWNDMSVPWRQRGFEHAAEIVAWAIGERILTPTLPNVEPEQLAEAYRALTGDPLREVGS
jgi:hypothetical protein